MDFQQHLIDNGIKQSRIRALQDLNAESLSAVEYNERLKEFGLEDEIADDRLAKYTYLYAVQNGFDGIFDLSHAHLKAESFLKENAWSFAATASQSDMIIDKKTGEERRKKGWKKLEAISIAGEIGIEKRAEIIAAFQSKLDMSKTGATTYFYIVKEALEGAK